MGCFKDYTNNWLTHKQTDVGHLMGKIPEV